VRLRIRKGALSLRACARLGNAECPGEEHELVPQYLADRVGVGRHVGGAVQRQDLVLMVGCEQRR
jgi:hypothetical protein